MREAAFEYNLRTPDKIPKNVALIQQLPSSHVILAVYLVYRLGG